VSGSPDNGHTESLTHAPAGQPSRTSRRRFVQGATATGGALVAATYVKPNLRQLGIPAALAVSEEGTKRRGDSRAATSESAPSKSNDKNKGQSTSQAQKDIQANDKSKGSNETPDKGRSTSQSNDGDHGQPSDKNKGHR